MKDGAIFQDEVHAKIITPYAKLRKEKGWSQEQAAAHFFVSRRTIVDIESGKRDPSKQLVRAMDREYQCEGKLIEYWLPRFSVSPHRAEAACAASATMRATG